MLHFTVGVSVVQRKKASRGGFLLLASALCTGLVGFSVARAAADFVLLKNGKRMNGLVRAETPERVVFETAEGITLTFDRATIDRIEKQMTGENLLLSGALALRKPDFVEAADLFNRSLETGVDAGRMRTAILETSPHFLDKMAYMSNTERKQWRALCDELSRRGANDADWTYFRGDMALAIGDPAAALAAWRSLDAAHFAAHPERRDRIIKWALPRLSQAVNSGKLEESIGMLELINALDPVRAKSCRVVLAMEKARAARERGTIAEACRIYAEEVMPLAPEVGKVCLRASAEPEGDVLCDHGNFNEAIALVRSCVKPHVPELATRLLAKIYRAYIARMLADGKWETARGLLAESSEVFDDAELRRLKAECEYAEMRSRIAAEDYGGHFKLGMELQEKKMNGAAIEEFILAGRSPKLKELAEKQIALIQEGGALALLEKIVSQYGEGKYLEVLDAVGEFRQKFPNSDLSSKVDAISKLSHQKLAEQAKTAEALALSRLEQARRLLYQNKANAALELVDGVLHDQFTTATVATEPLIQARALKQEILKNQIAEGVGGTRVPAATQPTSSPVQSLLPNIDPALLNQLNEDAFKKEIQEILKQLQL